MSGLVTPNAWCEIYLDRISRNIELALGLLPKGSDFCAVLKADAYGHGIAQVAPLVKEHGIKCVGISSNHEARSVRDAGFSGRLIRLRAATPSEIVNATADRVEEQVSSLEIAHLLKQLRNDTTLECGVHLALNAGGMSRDGLEISTRSGREQCERIVDALADQIVGICSHIPSNEASELLTSSDHFHRDVAWIVGNSSLRRSQLLVHAGSSLTLCSGAPIKTDMYRCGAIMYGILEPDLGFRPTMELKANVVSVGDYPCGSTVGYDRSVTLESDRQLACISVGYANGFSRNAVAPYVIINGERAKVIGKTSMNTIVADVSNMNDVDIGVPATVFGGSGNAKIGIADAETTFNSIMADLYTDWGLRNCRRYRSEPR